MYIFLNVQLKKTSSLRLCHHAGWGLQNALGLCSARDLWAGGGSLLCHACCNTGPRFSWIKELPYLIVLDDKRGVPRIYSQPNPYDNSKRQSLTTACVVLAFKSVILQAGMANGYRDINRKRRTVLDNSFVRPSFCNQ